MRAEAWFAYVHEVAATQGDITDEAIGRRIKMTGPSVNRWQHSVPKAESVARFARAYKVPVVEAFVAAGILTKEEANVQPEAPTDLAAIPTDALIEEVVRRLRLGDAADGQRLAAITAEEPTQAAKQGAPRRRGKTAGTGRPSRRVQSVKRDQPLD